MCPYAHRGQDREKSDRAGREEPCMQSRGLTDPPPQSHSWHHPGPALSPPSPEEGHAQPTPQHSHRRAAGLQTGGFLP